MKKRYQISYQLKVILNVVVYVVFFAYIVYSAVTAADTGTRLVFIVVGVFFGGELSCMNICASILTRRRRTWFLWEIPRKL